MEFYKSVAPEHKIRQRAIARNLRHSQWWKQLLARGVCYYCGGKFAPWNLNMDHKVPVARGGRSVKGNVVVSCKKCNIQKRHLTWAEKLIENL